MWQLIQDNFISNYHEYLGDLHHMLVALSKIQTFVFSWTPLVQVSLCRNIRRFNCKLWAGNILPIDRRLCAGAGICRCGDTLWSAGDLGRWGPRHQPLHRARPRTPHSWEDLGPHAGFNLWHHTLPTPSWLLAQKIDKLTGGGPPES